ncbi:MAG: zinc ribbon domain-containing protein [Planctomycetes bacterium]|nr:zinc ribbon domain-containing protein [Planctomycetota bacterium]
MPTYDYKCDACGYEFEKFQSITDGRLRKCPECGKMKLRRLIGAGSAVIFRGSGFYATDYRKSSPTISSSKKSTGSSDNGGSSGASDNGPKKDD